MDVPTPISKIFFFNLISKKSLFNTSKQNLAIFVKKMCFGQF